MMSAHGYTDHPNYLKIDGKPVLNPWQGTTKGEAWWQSQVIEPLIQNGKPVYFMPWFYSVNINKPLTQNIQNIVNEFSPITDAIYYWGGRNVLPSTVTPWYNNDNLLSQTFSTISHSVNKPYIGTVMAQLWQTCKGNNTALPGGGFGGRTWGQTDPVYLDYQGALGLENQWLANINTLHPSAIIIPTWNDVSESHYIAPLKVIPTQSLTPLITMYTHRGFSELTKYYIKWYKTGQQPTITTDKLFFFYRTQPKNIATPPTDQCPLITMDIDPTIKDDVYVTTMLTAPAQLVITSGSTTQTFNVSSGIQNTSMPFSPGVQTFKIVRNGSTIINAQGAYNIETNPVTRNYNLYGDYAEH
jgi:glucan endo-1,3-alpha-glucosidase